MLELILVIILYYAHKALVDLKMWNLSPFKKEIREKYWYLLGDGPYLIGTVVVFLLTIITAYTSSLNGYDFARMVAIGTLLGSECWDLIFGFVNDKDPFYPFADWYGGWGFETRRNRILFDINRIMLAIFVWAI